MVRSQQAPPKKKLGVEHVLLIIIGILVIFLIIRVAGGLPFLGKKLTRATVCIISSSSGYQAVVKSNPDQLANFIINLQTARYTVLTYGDDLNTLSYQIIKDRLDRCNLIIITNFKRVSQVLLNALYDYVQHGGRLIIIGDSLTERYIPGINGSNTGYIENLFGMQFNLKYNPATGTYSVQILEDNNPELIVFEPNNPIFKDCVPQEGKLRLHGLVKYVEVTDYDIDLLAWIKGSHGSRPAILEKQYGAGTVVIFTYDPLKYTPCILANTISYLVLGKSRFGLFGVTIPSKIF